MYIIYCRGSIFEFFDNKMCFIFFVFCNIKFCLLIFLVWIVCMFYGNRGGQISLVIDKSNNYEMVIINRKFDVISCME